MRCTETHYTLFINISNTNVNSFLAPDSYPHLQYVQHEADRYNYN